MCLRVIAENVTPSRDFANELRIFASESPNEEECSARIVAVEQIEQLRCNGGIRSVVEGDGELARRICSVDGRAK